MSGDPLLQNKKEELDDSSSFTKKIWTSLNIPGVFIAVASFSSKTASSILNTARGILFMWSLKISSEIAMLTKIC